MNPEKWIPAVARPIGFGRRPAVGDVIGFRHAVWAVTAVRDIDFDEDDERRWAEAGRPDRSQWWDRPYKLHVLFVGGARPAWAAAGQPIPAGIATIHARNLPQMWYVYPQPLRWPQCSCCGEPMPCRAALEDIVVAESTDRAAALLARLPGACWACQEPITSRQKSILYPGDNLELPGGPEARFHTRQSCNQAACAYEERWLAADPTRQRILTWPKCPGSLRVHADGTTDCQPHYGEQADGCQGHLTHDHGTRYACAGEDSCPRGCQPGNSLATPLIPRPPRNTEDQQ